MKRIAYCTPSLYIAGGVERVLTTKMNYLADIARYDVWVILTDGKDKQPYFELSPKIHVVNLDVNFEVLWHLGFLKKAFVYLQKQRIYKKRLTKALKEIKPDITVSTLRREVNFISSINDGSKKVGEFHVNRSNYRNFEANDTNIIKKAFAKFWLQNLVSKLKKLDKFIVLTDEDRRNWNELQNVITIPNPLNVFPTVESDQANKKVIAAGRYCYQKGFDLLLSAWTIICQKHPDWHLDIFGAGNSMEYKKLAEDLGICQYVGINNPTDNIYEKYAQASIFVFSSRFEGFGMALLEAMATKLAVVSFACPCGPSDIISDGTNGLLAKNGDIQELATKLCYLIEHEEDRKCMAENAKTRASDYSVDNIMRKWIELFESL